LGDSLTPKIQEALRHPWLTGENATDHNLLPEIKAFMAKARLRRGIEMVKLANRIEALKLQEEEGEESDMPNDAILAADQSRRESVAAAKKASEDNQSGASKPTEKRSLSKTIKGAIFREVVLAKVREMKQQQETLKVAGEVEKEAKRRSFVG